MPSLYFTGQDFRQAAKPTLFFAYLPDFAVALYSGPN